MENGAYDSYKEECGIIDLETGSPAFGKIPAGEVFFGVERDLFENTAFVGQIGDSSINEGSVKESIENILFSGSERVNNQRAAAKVSVKLESLLHKNGMGGVIYDLMKRTEEFDVRFREADEDNKKILALEAKLHEIKKCRDEEEVRKNKFCDLDTCYRNVLIIQEFDKLHALEEEYDEKCEEYDSFISENMKSGFVPTSDYLTDIAVARRGLDDSYHTLVDADRRYVEETRAVGITKEIEGAIALADNEGGEALIIEKTKKKRFGELVGAGMIFGGAVAFVAALAVEIAAKGALAATFSRIAFALVGLVGLLIGLKGAKSFLTYKKEREEIQKKFSTDSLSDFCAKMAVIEEARAKRDGMKRSTENARIAVEEAKAKYAKCKDELLEVILRWGAEPPHSGLGDFLDALEEKTKAYLEEEKRLQAEKSALEIKVRELRIALEDKSEIDIRAQVSPFKRKVLNEIKHEEILEGIEECKLKIAAQNILAEEVERELFTLKTKATDPGELYSKIQANDARIEELKSQHKAYYIALKAIESASDDLRLEISPRLGEYSTEMMEIMTDKKYTGFDVSDGLKVTFKDASGESKSVDFLSGGTRDLAYIAVRLALIDMLYTEKPPVCFDESFAHQDNVRATSMMRAIAKLAEEGQQSFVFTCRARESALATQLTSKTEIFKLTRNDAAII